jgi:cytidylate kinase
VKPDNTTPVIAIDGPSGSGKGVITQKLAAHLGFHILDSGALYRLIGLAARKHDIGLDDEDALASQAR